MNYDLEVVLMDKISVIIPVYNTELCINRCLDSVIGQTHLNLEILCVDDGSTDKSGRICEEYAAKDSRIKVFHKDNGGVSSARNVGLAHFTGAYLGFVDSDDWIEPDMYAKLYSAATDNKVGLSAVSFTRDNIIETPRESIPQRILTRNEMLLYAIRNVHHAGFGRVIWNKLFNSNIVRDRKLFFDESIVIAEDLKFLAEMFFSSDFSGVFVDIPLYHYSRRSGSLMCSWDHKRGVDELRSYQAVADAGDRAGLNDITIWLKRQHCYSASLLLEKAIKQNDTKLIKILKRASSLYINEYLETNSEYPERIERINKLLY